MKLYIDINCLKTALNFLKKNGNSKKKTMLYIYVIL